jgi:hypothetical protein
VVRKSSELSWTMIHVTSIRLQRGQKGGVIGSDPSLLQELGEQEPA